MISQRIQNIIDQIKRGEQQSALVTIQQQLKRHEKTMPADDLMQLNLLRGTILVQIGQPSEAVDIITKYVNQKEFQPGLHFIIALNLAKDLNLLGQMIQFYELHCPKTSNGYLDMYQMQLQYHNFDEAAKWLLKIYKDGGERNHNQLLEYVVLLSQGVNQGGPIVGIFMTKLDQLIPYNPQNPLAQQLIKFKLQYYKRKGDVIKVTELLNTYESVFLQYQQNCAIALWIYQQQPNDHNYNECILRHMHVFKSHQGAFIINFECQELLIQAFPGELHKADVTEPFVVVAKEQLISHIYNSCIHVLKNATNPLIVKSLILTAIKILNQCKVNEGILELAIQFYLVQGDKYSFCTELFKTIPTLDATKFYEVLQTQVNNKIVTHINLTKIKLYIAEDPMQYFDELIATYYKHEVPQSLEKGERLMQDDYLMMAVDLLFDLNKVDYSLRALSLLEIGLARSPYNYDFLMRQIVLTCSLGLVDKAIEQMTRLDIKGVQFDTLGFTFARAFLEFGGTYDQVEKKNSQALTFYLENIRDSKKNLITTLKQQNYETLQEFQEFEKWIDNSYIKLVYFTVQQRLLMDKHKNSASWYHQHILSKINTQPFLTYSISQNLFQSFFIRDFESKKHFRYDDYLGIYTNPQELTQLSIRLEVSQHIPNILLDDNSLQQAKLLINQQLTDKQVVLQKRNALEFNNEFGQLQYYKDYIIFTQIERQLHQNIVSTLIEIASLTVDSDLSKCSINVDLVQQLTTLILQQLNYQYLPIQLFRFAHKFYTYTISDILAYGDNWNEIKQRLFKLSKKSNKEGFTQLSKSLAAQLEQIKELLRSTSIKLLEYLAQNNYHEIIKQYSTNNSVEYVDQLSSQFVYQNIGLKSLIVERVKQMK